MKFLLLGILLSPLAQATEGEQYTVLLVGDESVFPRVRLGREIRRLEQKFGLPVLAYTVEDIQDFRSDLRQLTRLKTPIKNLFVRGIHGMNNKGIPGLEVRSNRNKANVGQTTFRRLAQEGVKLNIQPGAMVYFDSCTMVDDSSEVLRLKAFEEVKRIGFQTGAIYLNTTDGSDGVSNTFTVPFYQVPGNWKDSARVLAGQLIWPVILPVFYYWDRYVNNQGYLFRQMEGRHSLNRIYAGDVDAS